MTNNGYKILGNIIGAVKTGNNIYGQKNYKTYNLKNKTFALGWAQFSGNNVRNTIKKIYEYDEISIPQGSIESDIDYVRWAVNIADDNRYFYEHSSNPFSFSCSTLVAKALYECGYFERDVVPANGDAIGGDDTSILHRALFAAGFNKIPFGDTKMQPGDILVVYPYHIAFCVKGNIMVAANGNGDMTDKRPEAITTYDYRLVGTPKWIFRLPESKIHRSHSIVDKVDMVNIKALLKTNWTSWVPTAAQKTVLVNLMNCSLGHKAQDEFFKEKMKSYVAVAQKTTKTTQVIMMYCILRHLKGQFFANKILKECESYNLAAFIKTIKKHSPTEAELKTYQLCQEWIYKYAPKTTTSTTTTTETNTWKRTGTATCNSNSVNVRSTPEEKSGNILGILNKGQRFEVDGKITNGWVHVKVTGLGIGWMYKTWVKYD